MNTGIEYTASDYLSAFRRRRGVLLGVAIPIIVIAAAFSLLLPDLYTSFAQIDINLEGSNVRTLEPIEVTTYADQYIAELEDRVLVREKLLALANNTAIFSASHGELTESDRIDEIKGSVEVSVLTQLVISPNSGREVDLITGFRVASVATNPEFAFRVADYVAKLFLEEDRLSRTSRASSTSIFLSEQMSITEREILDLEKEVADFKVANACCLPELVTLNTSVIQRAERDIEDVAPRIRTLEQNRIFLQAQLEEIGQIGAATDRIEELEQEYMRLVANYGPDHPDVNRVRREIVAISGADSGGADAIEIIELRIKLAEAEQRYSGEHPDVIAYRRELAVLELKRRQGGGAAQSQLLDNPRYLQLRAELNSVNGELNELRVSQPALRKKIEEYEDRLARTPQVESEYQAINRKLETARDNFDDLQQRLSIARQTQALELTDIGARLLQIRPAAIPRSPSGPPRVAIMIIAIFFAGTLGVGSMLFAETTDTTVRGSKDIAMVMNMVPLATIPVIENSVSRATHQRRMYMMAGTMIVVIAAIAVFFFTAF